MNNPENRYLSKDEEALLLKIARDSLETYVREHERLSLAAYPLTAPLKEKHGAFVTLCHQGQLRGCIGYTQSIESLAEAVRDNAVNAATRDPRFPPVAPEELEGIQIEISALCPGEAPGSPFIRVHDISEIVLGRDGLYLEHSGPRGGGLLLPQVPLEHGWDLNQFLEGLCRKAGAPDNAWKLPESRLYRFSAQVFGEAG